MNVDIALNYVFFAMPFLVAMLLGLGMMLLGAVSFRNMATGVTMVLLTFVTDAFILGAAGLRLGISIYLPDVPMAILAVVAILRFMTLKEARPRATAFYVLAVVFALNLVHGLIVFKASAGPPARPTFYALATCAYLLTFPMTPERLRSLFNRVLWAGLALLAIAVYRGLITAFDVTELLPPGGSFQPAGHSRWRVISSAETLVLAEAFLALWAFYGVAKGWTTWRILAPLLLVSTVVLQHRSVWLALLAGVMVFYLGRARSFFDARNMLPVFVLTAALAGGMVAASRMGDGGGEGVGGDVVKSARDAAALQGTANERLGSWRQLVGNWVNSGPRTLALGQPFGTVYERITRDERHIRRITYQPHNYYVETLVSQGLIGLVAFLGVLGAALRGLWRLRDDSQLGEPARWLIVMLAFQMTYYLTYGVDYVQTLFLGAALALATRLAPAPKAAPTLRRAGRHPALFGRGR